MQHASYATLYPCVFPGNGSFRGNSKIIETTSCRRNWPNYLDCNARWLDIRLLSRFGKYGRHAVRYFFNSSIAASRVSTYSELAGDGGTLEICRHTPPIIITSRNGFNGFFRGFFILRINYMKFYVFQPFFKGNHRSNNLIQHYAEKHSQKVQKRGTIQKLIGAPFSYCVAFSSTNRPSPKIICPCQLASSSIPPRAATKRAISGVIWMK